MSKRPYNCGRPRRGCGYLARRLLRALGGIRAHPLEEMPDGSALVAQRLVLSDAVHFCG